ncbi:hypothetical protein DMC47_32495 [Nostoc sp. 3335mG]|nr:hypothetical protein DMC47_32495 [Nostoc sp. 3335mG]
MAIATVAGAEARYQPANVFGTGYADEQVAPGVWNVRGASGTEDAGHAIAIYRAAELAQAAGASEMRIVRQKIVVTSRANTHMFVREVAHFTVRAVRDPADRTACEEKKPERCVTVSVDKMLAQFGPELGQSPGPHPELAAARTRVEVSSGPIPIELIRAFNARQAAMGRAPLLPAAAQPVAALSTPQRPLSAYDQGRLAGAAARAAQQPGD